MLVIQIDAEAMHAYSPDLLPVAKAIRAALHKADLAWEISAFEGMLLSVGGLAQRANESRLLGEITVDTDEALKFAGEIFQCLWLQLIVRSHSANHADALVKLVVFDSSVWEFSCSDPDIMHALVEELRKSGIEAALVHNDRPYEAE